MVLDTLDASSDMLIFKNTYHDPASGVPKQLEIKCTDPKAPKELYFIHIEVKDLDNLPFPIERKALKMAARNK